MDGSCRPSVCGDGFLDPYGKEGCDDGDAEGADGCSAGCQVETGFRCDVAGEPCVPLAAEFLISQTQLTQSVSYSYVDLVVDWEHRLAYAGSREAGACVAVIDFQDELAPVLLTNLGPTSIPATLGQTCLGVALAGDGRYLLFTSEGADTFELWDLGEDPRSLAFQPLFGFSVPAPRRLDVRYVLNGTHEMFFATIAHRPASGQEGGFTRVVIDRGPTPSDFNVVSDSYQESCSHNFAAAGSGFLFGGCWEDGSSAVAVAQADMTTAAQVFDMNPGSGGGMWCGVADLGGHRIFLGGWVTGFFEVAPSGDPPISLAARFDTRDTAYRAVTAPTGIVGTGTRFYAVRSQPALDVWEWPADGSPRLVSHSPFVSVETEFYGVAVHEADRRAIIVSNHGAFVIADLSNLWPATSQPPTF